LAFVKRKTIIDVWFFVTDEPPPHARGEVTAALGVLLLQRRICMLRLAALFLIIAIIAAIFGFGGIAGTAASLAITLFWIAIVIAVILFLWDMISGRRTGL
jgi:uncharacterized membrane protein YtjA (UPF0391 family)